MTFYEDLQFALSTIKSDVHTIEICERFWRNVGSHVYPQNRFDLSYSFMLDLVTTKPFCSVHAKAYFRIAYYKHIDPNGTSAFLLNRKAKPHKLIKTIVTLLRCDFEIHISINKDYLYETRKQTLFSSKDYFCNLKQYLSGV